MKIAVTELQKLSNKKALDTHKRKEKFITPSTQNLVEGQYKEFGYFMSIFQCTLYKFRDNFLISMQVGCISL